MAKPIFVIRLPHEANNQFPYDNVSDHLHDYHVITVPEDRDDIAFECFNTKDARDIDIEELKSKIKQWQSR